MNNPDSQSGNERLDAIIAAYYMAKDRGERIDRSAFLAAHPEFKRELESFFADHDCLAEVAQEDGAPAPEIPLRGSNHATNTHHEGRASEPLLRSGSRVKYIGEYEVLEVIGAGGMGVVYKARQIKLNKIVALKMIRQGQLARPEEVRRFQAEARAAAKLHHPGIVPVHEVSVQHGQYYYAMDFVDGSNLSQLHREAPVPARRAAEIVRQLALAMQYAHGQGIVHRDLKPANVLLTSDGVARITDFGLAKRLWTEGDSIDGAQSDTGQVLGTANYMSPEQARGLTRLVGPATDIYSLGAVLYALLTQRSPFAADTPQETIQQVIHREPLAPRLLNPTIPRDLETICLKCLEKAPHARYGTMELLAADLERFLRNEPISARPVSRLEHLYRWCQRKPAVAGLWTAATLLIATFAIGGPIVATIVSAKNQELVKANDKLNKSNDALGTANTALGKSNTDLEAARLEEADRRREAELRLKQLEKGNAILSSIFRNLNPLEEQQEVSLQVILGQRLKTAVEQLDEEAVGDRLTVARLQYDLAVSLNGLGFAQDAVHVHEKAFATRKELLGPENLETLTSQVSLADCHLVLGNVAESAKLQQAALEIMNRTLSPDHETRLSSMNNLARVYEDMRRFNESLPLMEEVYQRRLAALGEDHERTLVSTSNLAEMYTVRGRYAEALPLNLRAVEKMRTVLPPDHPSTLAAISNLARVHVAMGHSEAALELYEEVLPKMQRKWGADHAQTLRLMNNMAGTHMYLKQYEPAVDLYEKTLALMRNKWRPDHPDTLTTMGALAMAYNLVGRTPEAIILIESSLAGMRRNPGPEHPQAVMFQGMLARIYETDGRHAEALPLLQDTLSKTRATLGVGHNSTNLLVNRVIAAQLRAKNVVHAKLLVEEYRQAMRDHPRIPEVRIANFLLQAGDDLLTFQEYIAAEQCLRECLRIGEREETPEWMRFHVRGMLGEALAGQKKFDEAEPLLRESYDGLLRVAATIPAHEQDCQTKAIARFVTLYDAWGKPVEAARWRKTLAEAEKAAQGPTK